MCSVAAEPNTSRLVAYRTPEWALELGTEYLPQCRACGCSTTWVGRGVSDSDQLRAENRQEIDGFATAPMASEWECPHCGLTCETRDFRFARLPAGAARHPIFSPKRGHKSTGDHLSAVAALTSYSRSTKCRDLEDRGMTKVVQGARNQGPYISKWHADRAKGQREWLDRRLRCGAPYAMMQLTDVATGEAREKPLAHRCDDWRTCRECADRRRWKASQHAMEVTRRVLSERSRQYRKGYRGKEGRHSPRLLTVTVPHGDSLAADVALIGNAWPKLLRKINAHYKSVSGQKAIWCRALEVTPGSDGAGHAHYHVWLFGPFIDGVLVRMWWGEILSELGRECPTRDAGRVLSEARDYRVRAEMESTVRKHGVFSQIPWPVTDVRGERDALDYVNKGGLQTYTQKGGEYYALSAVHHAMAIEALSDRRCVQWCKGYGAGRKERRFCVSFRKHTTEELKALNDAMTKRVSATRERETCQPSENTTTHQSGSAVQSTAGPPSGGMCAKSVGFLGLQLELL